MSNADPDGFWNEEETLFQDDCFHFELTEEASDYSSRTVTQFEKGNRDHVKIYSGLYPSTLPERMKDDTVKDVARHLNDLEVKRLIEERTRAENDGPSGKPAEMSISFYDKVLEKFWEWYRRHNHPFPDKGESPSIEGTKVSEYVREAHPHLDRAHNLKELRDATYGEEVDNPSYHAFRQALKRKGFYVPDESRPAEDKYEEMAERIRAFVDKGRLPKLPSDKQ